MRKAFTVSERYAPVPGIRGTAGKETHPRKPFAVIQDCHGTIIKMVIAADRCLLSDAL